MVCSAQVLAVCAKQGLLRPGLVAIDGTKLVANASKEANRTAEQVAEEILAEAAAIDAAEDAAEESDRRGVSRLSELRSRGQGAGPGCAGCSTSSRPRPRSSPTRRIMARRAAKEAETGQADPGQATHAGLRQKHSGRQHANITDPDSRLMNTKDGFVQGYNAQAVATDGPVRDRRRGHQPSRSTPRSTSR